MKKITTISIAFLIMLICYFISCTKSENRVNESIKYYDSTDQNKLQLIIIKNNLELIFNGFHINSQYVSNVEIKENNKSLFVLDYNIDINEIDWKLKQAEIVTNKSTQLFNKNISIKILKEIIQILNDHIDGIFETSKNNRTYLVSLLSFHKSIINTAINASENNQPCSCAVHPTFLLDKSFFNCQEEQQINIMQLKEIIQRYSVSNTITDNNSLQLLQYLDTTKKTTIRFDDYYNFYIKKEVFKNFISEKIKNDTSNINYKINAKKNCAWWCPLGCGSDHGCCGNYTGCCLFWSMACFIHDELCVSCKPAWFCLPGCKPDK